MAHHRRSGPPVTTWGESPYLHLGCGTRYLPGWINADAYSAGCTTPDVVLDLHRDCAAIPSESLTWIYSSHVIEHVFPDLLPGILKHLCRSLNPGGKLTIATTDLDGIYQHRYRSPDDGPHWECALFGLTRSTDSPFDAHRDCFTVGKLSRLMLEAGFGTARPWEYGEYPELHALRDFGSEARLVSCLVEGIK
jgi:predicted SAM-dependent methyltransferase